MKHRKVVIVGDGAVGSTIAFTLALNKIVKEIAIVDLNKKKAEGDADDIADGGAFLPNPKKIYASSYEDVKDASLVIITAGAAQKVGETRLDLFHKNAQIVSSIMDAVSPFLSPKAIVLMVTNPVDLLTRVAADKLNDKAVTVIGSGTVLDTSRLKNALSRLTGMDPRNIHASIVGEHGDSEIALFSNASVGGVPLQVYFEDKKISLRKIEEEVRQAAYSIIERKGATNYAVAMAVNRIVNAILLDEKSVLTISTPLETELGEEYKGVYLSLPVIVGKKGAEARLPLHLNEKEKTDLTESAKQLKEKYEEFTKMSK